MYGDPIPMNEFRQHFPVTEEIVYMNVANHSPPSVLVKAAITEFLSSWDRLGRRRRDGLDRLLEKLGEIL